jgi:uncharacterized protein (DUF302 family)
MKNSVKFLLGGLILGGILAVVLVFFMSPGLMLKEKQSNYNFEDSMTRLEETVLSNGWTIPAKHDLRKSLLKHGKSEVNNIIVYELCNPDLAEKILLTDNERVVSNFMPCRISLYEKSDGKVYYSMMNAGLLSKPMGKVAREQMKIAAKDMDRFVKVLE